MKRELCVFLVISVPTLALSNPADETICDAMAADASQESGVPLAIMRAITRVETMTARNGISGPWPWTINHAGQGEWFDTAQAALQRIDALIDAGEHLDIGCFQINTHWHGEAFASAEEMLGPAENARYAASYLRELYAEAGDWRAAVAAYHSRDPDRGAGYAKRVAAAMRDTPMMQMPTVSSAVPRVNRFPLMLAGDPATKGSLFGATGLQAPLIGP